jgi:hypothetical protein
MGSLAALAQHLKEILIDEGMRNKMGTISYEFIRRWGISEDVEGVLNYFSHVSSSEKVQSHREKLHL